ncbi:MAG TPA: DsbA family oxidoreductase [Acidimicrobiales bacterium]|nr:DsbA family oxidoreductase [Acidimicrobiales bacterium]
MRVDIWSDVVCPWCYLGKRHLELALAGHERAGEVEVFFHSFELDPEAPAGDHRPMRELIARKYGLAPHEAARSQEHLTSLAASVGLEYHLEATRRANTFDAHRLLHLARDLGRQSELAEALFAAYFTGGRVLGEHEELVAVATGAGLAEQEVRRVLGSEAYAEHVRRDEQAAVELGATGVPFFVVGGRYGLAGAQPPEVLAKVLDRAFEESA